jgi:hypothetical protein
VQSNLFELPRRIRFPKKIFKERESRAQFCARRVNTFGYAEGTIAREKQNVHIDISVFL